MAKEELIQLNLTDWEKDLIFELLSNKDSGKCSFGVMADMLQLRTDLKEGKDITVRPAIFNEIYNLLMNPNLRLTISEDAMNLYNKFKELKS